MMAEEQPGQDLVQDPPPETQNKVFHWTTCVTGDEQKLVWGSSASLYLNNKLTVNAGATTTLNLANLTTNINAGTTMNLNLAPSVTYQVADTLITGPGRVDSVKKDHMIVGLDSIKLVAGLEDAARAKCLAGWQRIAFAAATLLGMATSIVPPVYNHFSPEDRLEPQHQAIGAFASSVSSFLFWAMESRVFRVLDRDDPRFGGTKITMDSNGLSLSGSRQGTASFDPPPASEHPAIMLSKGNVWIQAAQQGSGANPPGPPPPTAIGLDADRTAIGLGADRLIIQGEGTKIDLTTAEMLLHRHPWELRFNDSSIRLGSDSSDKCQVEITKEDEVTATGKNIRLEANGAAATFDAQCVKLKAQDQLILDGARGVSINGQQLRFDAGGLINLG
jgi:hypothetical protein